MDTEQINSLDREIDDCIPGLPLLAHRRDRALLHVLNAAETAYFIRASFPALRPTRVMALQFAIPWIFKHCRHSDGPVDTSFRRELLTHSAEYLHACDDYVNVEHFMRILRKYGDGSRTDNHVEVRFTTSINRDIAAAENLFFSPDDPTVNETQLLTGHEIDSLVTESQPRVYGKRLTYNFPMAAYRDWLHKAATLHEDLWQLDGSWELGGYTINDWRRLWSCLAAFAGIHHLLHTYTYSFTQFNRLPFETLTSIKTRQEWLTFLEQITSLDKAVIGSILDDMIFDQNLYLRTGASPLADIACQPFFQLNSGDIAFSNHLLIMSNAERNFWKLIRAIKEPIHSRLSIKQEAIWRDELIGKLQNLGYNATGGYRVNQQTDLDLLVIDPKRKQGLSVELKWFTAPGWLREYAGPIRELAKGVQQVKTCLEWLTTAPQSVTQKTGLSRDELLSLNMKGMVLSKNTIGSGFAEYRDDIPLVSERLLEWTLFAKKTDLHQFHSIAAGYKYLPKAGVDYSEEELPASFGHLTFAANIGWMPLRKNIRPDELIDFPSL